MDYYLDDFLIECTSFTTDDFTNILKTKSPDIGRSTVFNILKQLCEKGVITRKSKGQFEVSKHNNYTYDLSETAKDISVAIQEQFPLVNFQVWELYQMNEFVNHQLSRNTIFVEVESMLDESVFNLFFDKYPHVLHNAGIEEYYKYAGEETIVVRKLISEAPPGVGQYKQASLEKILVDLFARGISGTIISRSEYSTIYEDSFRKYAINQPKMFRYARRRGIEKNIVDFIHENTNVVLENGK